MERIQQFFKIENKASDHDHDNKYIATSEFNKLTIKNFIARSTLSNLVTKTDFDAKLESLNKKIDSNKTKHLLVENELKKLKTFDLDLFISQSYFNSDGVQLFLIFQPILKTITTFSGLPEIISQWESKGCHMKRSSILIEQIKVFLQN